MQNLVTCLTAPPPNKYITVIKTKNVEKYDNF